MINGPFFLAAVLVSLLLADRLLAQPTETDMKMSRTIFTDSVLLALLFLGPWLVRDAAAAPILATPYDSAYTVTSLGSVPGLPPLYGGLTFFDANTILIGGNANTAAGRLYFVDVSRDAFGHVTGFSGSASVYGSVGEFNDGGVTYGPGGVLFTAQWPVNNMGQTLPGATDESRVDDLGALGVADSVAGLGFVPAGFPGAGQLKAVSWSGGQWYTVGLTPDGLGTFVPGPATLEVTIGGGPEGIFYVPLGSPLFPGFNVLVAEYSAGTIGAYSVDVNGDPILATRTDFMTGLTGAEGAAIDPVTGDFFFSTFGGGNQVVRVSGFAIPPPTSVPEPSTLALLGTMLFGVVGLSARRRLTGR